MTYPSSPWRLQGQAILTLQLLPIDKVRSLVPTKLKIIPILPGKTIGGVYLSEYRSGSILEYSELIVCPAFVAHKGKLGAWISHIYVDNPDSVAGGREIWKLPKQLAEFTWEKDNRVTVCQEHRVLCNLDFSQPSFTWRQWLSGSSFSGLNQDLLWFSAELESDLGFVNSKLEIPAESPLFALNILPHQPRLSVLCQQMHLKVNTPTTIGTLN